MKKYSIVILGVLLGIIMTSCAGAETSTIENINKEVVEIKDMNYVVEEIGEVDYQVWNHYEDIYTIYKDGYMGYMDLEGNILCEPKYFWVSYGDGMVTIEERDTGKKYYQSLDGSVTIDKVDGMEFAATEDFKDGYAIVRLKDEEGVFQEFDKVIDKQGNVVLETDKTSTFFRRDKDGNYVLTDGLEIFEVYKKDLTPMSKKEIKANEELDGDYVQYKDGLYVIADKAAYTAFYDNEKRKVVSDYVVGFGPVKVGSNYLVALADTPMSSANYVLINDAYEEVAKINYEFNYTLMPEVINDKIILRYKDEPVKVLDENGELYKETEYYTIYQDKYGTIYCAEDGYVGLLDNDLNEVVAPEYDYITEVFNGEGLAQKDNMLYKVTATEK